MSTYRIINKESKAYCMDKGGWDVFETSDPIEAMKMLFWYRDNIKTLHKDQVYQLVVSEPFVEVKGVYV